MSRLLLLAGTAEARALATAMGGGADLIVSLAGVTGRPAAYPGTVRTGGFGGAAGLAGFIRESDIAAVIDATHPFAAGITANAAAATLATGVPLLRLCRPPWQPRDGEVWRHVPDLPAALAALPEDARPFLATGAGSLDALRAHPTLTAILRSIEPVPDLPAGIRHVRARPPFTLASETALLRSCGASHLVTRNAGGATGREKLDAAAGLGIEVVMIDRPARPEAGVEVATVAAALDWLRGAGMLDLPEAPRP